MKFNKLEDAIERGIIDHIRSCEPGTFRVESSSLGHDYNYYNLKANEPINILELVPAIAARVAKLAKDGKE